MIYICTHTDFNEYLKEGDYTILSVENLKNKYSFPVVVADNDLEPLHFGYSEGYLIKDLYEKLDDSVEWVGINHYRRYFNNPKNETTLPTPLRVNMHRQYGNCHNIKDLYKVEEIIDKYYPEYSMDYSTINELYPCNMFIMNRTDFNEYCRFVLGVLAKFDEEHGFKTDDDIYNYVKNNQAQYNRKIDVKYQSRLQGFLMERLGTIFFVQYFKNKSVSYRSINIVANKIRNY